MMNNRGSGHSHHGHEEHGHHLSASNKSILIAGIVLNLFFVAVELTVGFLKNSVGLISDAGHNLSDVASMLLALAACMLVSKRASETFTYGYKKSTVLISVANAVILILAVIFIIEESVKKLINPEPVSGISIMIVAGIGVLVNGITTWLLLPAKDKDLNMKGAYLHMFADTLVSIGVIISGLVIRITGWNFIDPIVGIIIAFVIMYSGWGLLKESIKMALDAVPDRFRIREVEDSIRKVDNVIGVHHIHLWGMSTTEYALTAHIIIDDISQMENTKIEVKQVLCKLGISHSTLEIEERNTTCPDTLFKTAEK